MADEEKKKKGLGGILMLIIIPAVVAVGATVATIMLLGTNLTPKGSRQPRRHQRRLKLWSYNQELTLPSCSRVVKR